MNEHVIIPLPAAAKAIIFDLDGTLIDSMPLHFEGYQYALKPWGVHYPIKTFHSRAGIPSVDTMEMIRDDFRLKDFDVEEAMNRKREYVNGNLDKIKLIEPAFKILKDNYEKMPISIGTGSNRKMVNMVMEMMGLDKYIKDVVTSNDVTKHKPSPDTFLKCAQLMDVDPKDCVVYEDGVMGIEAAEAANMMVVNVMDYLDQP